MIRSDVVTGVMSFAEMDAMMYKIEGEDLYLIGTDGSMIFGIIIIFCFRSASTCFSSALSAAMRSSDAASSARSFSASSNFPCARSAPYCLDAFL